ncbi:MAG: DUF4260 domain-containing protein [Pseudomonadota bacterium]
MSQTQAGAVAGGPRLVLRAEAALLLVVLLVAYGRLETQFGGPSWWVFAALLLVPDLSMLGYLAGPRLGAAAYNAAHTALGPILVGAFGLWAELPFVTGLGLIWGAHVCLDRALGYGLKYETAFGDTHLGRLGAGKGRDRRISP